MCKLIETHPFGALHGGTLNLNEWTERYETVCKELEKVDTVEMEKARRDAGLDDEDEADGEVGGGEKEDEAEAEDGDEVGEDDEDEDEVEDAGDDLDDGGGSPKPKVKKAKKTKNHPRVSTLSQRSTHKPRISQIDLAAVEAEQTTTAHSAETIMKLRLTKKYYKDAIRFITQIEGAIPTLTQLLVSTNKTGVLEAMRFFRTAFEYDFVSAESGIKMMLHLIWTKDNTSSSEEARNALEGGSGAGGGGGAGGSGGGAGGSGTGVTEGKGVRAQLIDCYRSLYFDVVPDLAPKQQVNRIAKNMIE